MSVMPEGDVIMDGKAAGDSYQGGAGPVLLLLHGLGGTWQIWKPILALLERHHRVIALTLPGHPGGRAIPPGVEPTVVALTDAIMDELRDRGIERAHIAGNSLGGWLALELARRGFALSVTALSPAGAWRRRRDYDAVAWRIRIVFWLMPLMVVLTALVLRFGIVRRLLNRQVMEHGDRVPEAEVLDAMRAMNATRVLPALLRTMRRDGPIRPLRVSAAPLCIAWSERDKVIPFETYGKPMLDAVREAEAVTVKGAGHVPMYDAPGQVASVILSTTAKAGRPAR